MTSATSHVPDTITLTVKIPVADFPTNGKSVEVRLSDELVALVQNRGSDVPPSMVRTPLTLQYAVVTTASHAADEVHAAITRRINGRARPERYTLCDKARKRIVTGLRRAKGWDLAPLEEVTCKQCRNHLVQDGMLDPAE